MTLVNLLQKHMFTLNITQHVNKVSKQKVKKCLVIEARSPIKILKDNVYDLDLLTKKCIGVVLVSYIFPVYKE